MDSKKKIHTDVQLALHILNQKIDSLRKKVDKLCETTGCFEVYPPKAPPKDKK